MLVSQYKRVSDANNLGPKKNRHIWRFLRILVGLFFFARLPSSDRLRLGIAKVKKEKEVSHFHEIRCQA